MKTIILLLLLFILSISCVSTNQIVDNDDLYSTKARRDSIVIRPKYRYYQPNPYIYNDYWFWRWSNPYYNDYWQRPNIIIVQPKKDQRFRYERRPDRDGNGGVSVPIPKRRGRN